MSVQKTGAIDAGKTKTVEVVKPHADIKTCRLSANNFLTALDGEKRDELEGKGELATTTTCRAFALLSGCKLPVAYYVQDSPISFLAPYCRMLKWEVVVYRRAGPRSSLLQRRPELAGVDLDPPLVFFHLKTKDKQWGQFSLDCDDPLAEFMENGRVNLWLPKKPKTRGGHFLTLRPHEVHAEPDDVKYFPEMERIALKAFIIMERAWAMLGGRLDDFKVEFGIDELGRLLLGDVLDNDSGRLTIDGVDVSKQALSRWRKSRRGAAKLPTRRRALGRISGVQRSHAGVVAFLPS